jgi:hypothetical protein
MTEQGAGGVVKDGTRGEFYDVFGKWAIFKGTRARSVQYDIPGIATCSAPHQI